MDCLPGKSALMKGCLGIGSKAGAKGAIIPLIPSASVRIAPVRRSGLLLHIIFLSFLLFLTTELAFGGDLAEVKRRGSLKHLGVPYAAFVTGSGDGLDVELVQLFARHLGVEYRFVQTSWDDLVADLTGEATPARVSKEGVGGEKRPKGDMAACGITVLPSRELAMDFSIPTFPNQVWLVVRSELPVQPIIPTGHAEEDVVAVKARVSGLTVLGKCNTCLDPNLYDLQKFGARIKEFAGPLNELVVAVLDGEADATLLDVADAIGAMEKWPGRIKILGPVSPMQDLAYAFAKTSPDLREAFNLFFQQCKEDGTYLSLVKKYYPAILAYYPDFFDQEQDKP
jgi:ABC-type amino acid transport substrate-binding protein